MATAFLLLGLFVVIGCQKAQPPPMSSSQPVVVPEQPIPQPTGDSPIPDTSGSWTVGEADTVKPPPQLAVYGPNHGGHGPDSSQPSTAVPDLQIANIAFNPPDTVYKDSVFAIELDLSLSQIPDSTLEEIRKLSKPHAKITQKAIKVSKKVKAALTGDFAICSEPQIEQEIIDSSVYSWVWNIKATTPGTKYLNLDIVTIIEMNGKSINKSIKVFHEPMIVVVKENPKTWRDYLSQLFDKVDIKWLYSTILFPLAVFLWSLYQKWRKNRKSDTKPGKE